MIYEVKAYIGTVLMPYTCIFATMKAAKEDADRLVNGCNLNGIPVDGFITPMAPISGKYETVAGKMVFFNNNKEIADQRGENPAQQ